MAWLFTILHMCLVWQTEAWYSFDTSQQLLPVDVKSSSTHPCSQPTTCGAAKFCSDSDLDTRCHTAHGASEEAPWVALVFIDPVWVEKVELVNVRTDKHNAGRLRNVEVRITNTLPTNGRSMFSGGLVLGNFSGPATSDQFVVMEGTPKKGKIVLVQMKHKEPLHLREIRVFGLSKECMGKKIELETCLK
eukprot:TRINITY_DN38360_c0_g1_i1.p1 TRINITY_DN38360_c0_g1~~TRINITY_DN38360_c0_g1_i1.p1  ORF type:complete len:190 (-),score=29.70 TRINITY_DN38360_c0_g1_i1:24-593(-)